MHVCGNVLHLLCVENMENSQGSPEHKMEQLWKEIDKLYHERNTSSQFPHLSLNSFRDTDKPHAHFPLLKGKGAQIRHVVQIIALIWKCHMRHSNEYRNDRVFDKVLGSLVAFYECLDYHDARGIHPFHLPAHVSTKVLKHVEQLLVFYHHLSKDSMLKETFRWNVVPKHHYFLQIANETFHLNPRMTWCYENEDFVCNIAIIGMSCRHGQVAASRSKGLCTKYISGITLRMFHDINCQ